MAAVSERPDRADTAPIAVDAAGGDRGLSVQVEGAIQASKEFGCSVTLVGPEWELKQLLEGYGALSAPIKVVHAPEVIAMDDSPTRAIRKKPDSSLVIAYNLLERGEARAILSSGNSGAMMAAGRFICGLLPGIERPAIATLIPTAGEGLPNVILDSGANVECHAHHLVQFAVMGSIYFESLFKERPGGIRPRVALLSNGEEPTKGTDVIRSAYSVLSQMQGIDFSGYVEGRDVPTGRANVIVCDGMVGKRSVEGDGRLCEIVLRSAAS